MDCSPPGSSIHGIFQARVLEWGAIAFSGQHRLDHGKSKRIPEKSTSALLTMQMSLIMWITTNWKILKEMGMPDHLTCLLRNLYAGQEATVRTRYGAMDWFQIGKGVRQGCILSPCLFNFFVDYIM